MIFKNIGEFYLNTENKICFQAYNTKSFSHNFYGLEDFSRLPLNKSELNIIINKETNTKNIVMDNDKKENLAFEPESKEPAKKGKFKLVAIITSLIVLSVCGYYFGNEYIQNERIRSTEIAQKKIKNTVQKATYDIGSISSLELNIKANIETVEDDMVLVEQGKVSLSDPVEKYIPEFKNTKVFNKKKGFLNWDIIFIPQALRDNFAGGKII